MGLHRRPRAAPAVGETAAQVARTEDTAGLASHWRRCKKLSGIWYRGDKASRGSSRIGRTSGGLESARLRRFAAPGSRRDRQDRRGRVRDSVVRCDADELGDPGEIACPRQRSTNSRGRSQGSDRTTASACETSGPVVRTSAVSLATAPGRPGVGTARMNRALTPSRPRTPAMARSYSAPSRCVVRAMSCPSRSAADRGPLLAARWCDRLITTIHGSAPSERRCRSAEAYPAGAITAPSGRCGVRSTARRRSLRGRTARGRRTP